jgi:hypothetical protein
MEKETRVVAGVTLIFAAWWGYKHFKKPSTPKLQNALSGNLKGYTSLMKLSPNYYNATSTESVTSLYQGPDTYSDPMLPTPWVLPAEQGNAELVSAGWTNWGDAYSARVSHQWVQQAVAGSHL